MAKRKNKNLYLMPEPDWLSINNAKTEEEKQSLYRKFEYFVHYEIADKKADATVPIWLEKDSGLDPELIKKLKRVPDVWFRTFAKHTYIWTKTNGYMHPDVRKHLLNKIPELQDKAEAIIEEKQKKEEEKPKVVISIQERMRQQVSPLMAEWEFYIDQLVDGVFDLKKFDPYNEMRAYDGGCVKPNHAKIIKDEFQNQYKEALLVKEWSDEYIKEAYSNFDKKTRDDYLAFYEKINSACDTLINTGKATRKTRVKKAPSKEKLVAKLKYQLNDPELGIASVNPTDIIEATEVWVYNTKTRKLGVYTVDDLKTGLTVKGTSILDFNTNKSVQKTLRKPAEQLKLFKGTAKTKYTKAFKEIKTTDTKLNGRFNDSTVILKAF